LVYRDSDGLQLPRVVVERETLNGCTRNRLLHVVPQAARSIRDWTFRVPTEEARSPLDVRGVRTERHAMPLNSNGSGSWANVIDDRKRKNRPKARTRIVASPRRAGRRGQARCQGLDPPGGRQLSLARSGRPWCPALRSGSKAEIELGTAVTLNGRRRRYVRARFGGGALTH
jgi:hypothetical protein